MSEPHLLTEIHNGVGLMTFNRPEVMNAFSPEIVEGLVEASHAFERDERVRCVLIRGKGDHFVAGGNPKDFRRRLDEDRSSYVEGAERRVVNAHLAIHRLRRMKKPVLVSVQGAAAGFGFSLVVAADFVIAADTAYFAPAYCRIGLPGDGGVTYFLPRIVGERRAIEILLLGERFDAAAAHEWGLVNKVVSGVELEAATMDWAARLARGPTLAYGLTKTLVRGSLERSFDEQSALEARFVTEATASADHREGIAAFEEKRYPHFSGR